MAETTLVDFDSEGGAKLVQLLDQMGVDVRAAFWIYQTETDRSRLVIVTPAVKGEGRLKSLLLKIIEMGSPLDLGSVDFKTPDDPVYVSLSADLQMPGVNKAPFKRTMINGVYLEEALIYRLVA